MDDKQKQQMMMAVMAFNFTFMIVMFALWFTTEWGLVREILIAMVAAGVVAGIAYFIGGKSS